MWCRAVQPRIHYYNFEGNFGKVLLTLLWLLTADEILTDFHNSVAEFQKTDRFGIVHLLEYEVMQTTHDVLDIPHANGSYQ